MHTIYLKAKPWFWIFEFTSQKRTDGGGGVLEKKFSAQDRWTNRNGQTFGAKTLKVPGGLSFKMSFKVKTKKKTAFEKLTRKWFTGEKECRNTVSVVGDILNKTLNQKQSMYVCTIILV